MLFINRIIILRMNLLVLIHPEAVVNETEVNMEVDLNIWLMHNKRVRFS